MILLELWYIFFNLDSPHASLNSHYKGMELQEKEV